jgi:hypothetical protein
MTGNIMHVLQFASGHFGSDLPAIYILNAAKELRASCRLGIVRRAVCQLRSIDHHASNAETEQTPKPHALHRPLERHIEGGVYHGGAGIAGKK